MNRKKLLHIFYMVATAVLIFVCVDAVGFFQYGASRPQQEKLVKLNEGWVIKQSEATNPLAKLPNAFKDTAEGGVLFRQLPTNLTSDTILAFQNQFQDVEVKIDGKQRYSYSGLLPNSLRRMNSNVLCIIHLEEKDRGKSIEVFFHSPWKQASLFVPEFLIGTETEMLLEFFRMDVSSLVFSGIMILFAILFFAMFIRERIDNGENCGILAHTAILMALSSIWSVTNAAVVHMCVQNEIILAYLSYNSFMLLPIAIPIFYADVLERHKRALQYLAGIAAFNFMLQNSLNLLGKVQYLQMMPITYSLFFFSILALIGISVREFTTRKSYFSAGFLIATIVFWGFYILDAFHFFYNTPLDNAKFYRYGVFAFIVIILWICGKRMLCYVEVEVENRVYKELAFRDVLTHLPNRVALEKRIESLEKKEKVCNFLTVILMDVNGLKPVNDKSGHGAGDRLLCEAAKSIKEAFPEEKDAWYRLGGDEFVVLMTETELNNEECQQRLLKTTEKWKNFEHGPVSISCGSKSGKDVKLTKEVVQQFMHEADQMMYKNKIQYYQKKLMKRNSQETV
ncbi:MAG: diguanylate cyclase [Anaerotignum sp.]|nr:diguanylate cyclase [Anaerotignum sp.]